MNTDAQNYEAGRAPRFRTIFLLVVGALLFPSLPVPAGEFERLVREGNKLYSQAQFKEAEEKYILSQEERRESAIARFNIGNTYFEREDYVAAIEHYLEALPYVKTDRELELRLKYNLANARVRESERHIGDLSDPEKQQSGMNFLREAVSGYRDVLAIDPTHEKARQNLSICQLRIKQLFDEIRRRAEQQKDQEKQGRSPVEILRELIAEEKEEVRLTEQATVDTIEKSGLQKQLLNVQGLEAKAHDTLSLSPSTDTAAVPAGTASLQADLNALEADPDFVIGAAEITAAKKAVTSGQGDAAKAALEEARVRLQEAAEAAAKRLREGLASDRTKQQQTRSKTAGFVGGLQATIEGKQPEAAPGSPAGQTGQPGPPPPPPQPPPPEIAEILKKVKAHTEEADKFMVSATGLLGEESPTDAEAIAADVDLATLLISQNGAVEKLEAALEEAEKLPKDKQQQNQQQNPEDQEGDEDQEKQDKEKKDEENKDGEEQGDQQNQGDQQEQGDQQQEEGKEKKLSEDDAEQLLRKFLRRDRERQKDRKGRRMRGSLTGGLEKDW